MAQSIILLSIFILFRLVQSFVKLQFTSTTAIIYKDSLNMTCFYVGDQSEVLRITFARNNHDIASFNIRGLMHFYDVSLQGRAKIIDSRIGKAIVHSTLVLEHVICSDAGVYECRLRTQKKTLYSQPVNFSIKALPEFVSIINLNVKTPTVGSLMMLDCKAYVGYPPSSIRWLRKTRESNSFSVLTGNITTRQMGLDKDCQYVQRSTLRYVPTVDDTDSLSLCVSLFIRCEVISVFDRFFVASDVKQYEVLDEAKWKIIHENGARENKRSTTQMFGRRADLLLTAAFSAFVIWFH